MLAALQAFCLAHQGSPKRKPEPASLPVLSEGGDLAPVKEALQPAEALWFAGKLKEARLELERLCSSAGQLAEACSVSLGGLSFHLQDFDKARAALEKALSSTHPVICWNARLLLAFDALRRSDAAEARKQLAECGAPPTPGLEERAAWVLALAHLLECKPAPAIEILERLRKQASSESGRLFIALGLLSVGKNDGGRTLLSEVSQQKLPVPYRKLAQLALVAASGRWDEALFRETLSLNPRSPAAWMLWARFAPQEGLSSALVLARARAEAGTEVFLWDCDEQR